MSEKIHRLDPVEMSEVEGSEIVCTGKSAFGECMPASEILDHIFGHEVTVCRDGDGRIVAFGSTHIRGDELYMSGIAVARKYQGKGIASKIVDTLLCELLTLKCRTLTMRTQNELVERTVQTRLANLVQSGSIQSFSIQRVLHKALYGRQLAELMPEPSRFSPYSELTRVTGDAYALTFTITY